jgi:hypothetical protein
MITPRTPAGAVDAHAPEPDLTLERGFVASLRWLVSEGDARGVRRIAVELRALREALATLDEARLARDEHARRAADLDRELHAALAILGPGTAINGNGTLVQRLMRLRERLAEDTASREQLAIERDAWRAMCTLLTQTRAGMQDLLENTERDHRRTLSEVAVLRERVVELTVMHDDAAAQTVLARQQLAVLREQLTRWSGTVERALGELLHGARELAD